MPTSILTQSPTSARQCVPFQPYRSTRRSGAVRPVCASKQEALEEMERFKAGLKNSLKATETDAVTAAKLAEEDDGLPEVDGETFWPVINKESAGKTVVVLCYTKTCAPCKAVKPMLVHWSKEMDNVAFLKFQLTLPNKERALEFEVRSSPQFLLFRDGKLVDRMRGKLKIDDLESMIRSNSS